MNIIKRLFEQELADMNGVMDDDPVNDAALPSSALQFLEKVCNLGKVKKVFEFGSGQSTIKFLKMGMEVTSIEDSEKWMDLTISQIPKEHLSHFTPIVAPLKTRFIGIMPVKSWKITSQMMEKITESELILIDSPHYTPFREQALIDALSFGQNKIVILDDMRIPTLKRFCEHLCAKNKRLLYKNVHVGHGMGIFANLDIDKLNTSKKLVETIKGIRRYLNYPKFCRSLEE